MPRAYLPDVSFEAGICLVRRWKFFGAVADRRHWLVVGRLSDGMPFLLDYTGGVASWDAPEKLGASLRKKILDRFRNELRRQARTPPACIRVYDLRKLDDVAPDRADAEAAALLEAFRNEAWRSKALADEDWVDLAVPYAEKDEAKDLGARWNPARRVWQARADEQEAFSRWLTKDAQGMAASLPKAS